MKDPFANEITKARRHLPHWRADNAIYWVTFRLADSIPHDTLQAWRAERDYWVECQPPPWDEAAWREYNERFGDRYEKWLDAGMGSCALANPDVRDVVRKSLTHFNGERLTLHAAVIMPTHTHCLLEPLGGFQLSKLLGSIKGFSAHEANKILARSGTFWQDESYDHIVRSEAQYNFFVKYIQENPVKAKLPEGMYWVYA